MIDNVPWNTYAAIRELLDSPSLKMTYLKGTLELMSPSRKHESRKKQAARLLELYALERDIPLFAYGGMTFRKEERARALEPDECYCVGTDMRDYPDIAIEVVVSGWRVNKLKVYQGLGVREVWLFRDDAIQVMELGKDGYAPIEASRFFPQLDLKQLASFAAREDQHAALREYRELLRSK